jgi:hypothetical protein
VLAVQDCQARSAVVSFLSVPAFGFLGARLGFMSKMDVATLAVLRAEAGRAASRAARASLLNGILVKAGTAAELDEAAAASGNY